MPADEKLPADKLKGAKWQKQHLKRIILKLIFKNPFFYSLVVILAGLSCKNPDFWGDDDSSAPAGGLTASSEACQFYKAQSLIINCHERRGFFKAKIKQQKDTIAVLCAKKAFASVWGANVHPSPQTYSGAPAESANFNWWFVWGNLQAGSPPSSPGPVEGKYLRLLNQFKSSLDTGRMNSCLGGNYPFDGPTIIKTSFNMMNLDMLEPKVFTKCYKEQLELYRAKNSCQPLLI